MTRDEILEAAALIFGKKGYHATSMQDIADAVDLQKASLYHHFSSKQEILLALLDWALDILIERTREVILLPLAPDMKLRLAMISYLQTIEDYQSLSMVLSLEHRSLEEDQRQQHIQRRDQFEGLWRQIIAEGVEAGMFNPMDLSLAGKGVLGVLNWAATWYHRGGIYSAEEIAEQYARLFLEGLLVRKADDD